MSPDYKTNDPKGWCGDPKRGAALGRPTVKDASPDAPVKLRLSKIRLNVGGYDRNGTYFGSCAYGESLYWVADEEGDVDCMTRASGREAAKVKVRESYPNARFFR